MARPGGSRPPGLEGSAILHAHDEAQAGPDVVDRAHLVVDEPLPETDLAHDVLVEVGGYAGSSLGPCDPEAASRIEGSAQPAELLRQPGPRSEERHDHVGLAARPGNHAERAREPFGRGDEAHAAMLLDAKLLRQGRSRVAGHSSSVPGTLVRGKRAAPPGVIPGKDLAALPCAANTPLANRWTSASRRRAPGTMSGIAYPRSRRRRRAVRGRTDELVPGPAGFNAFVASKGRSSRPSAFCRSSVISSIS